MREKTIYGCVKLRIDDGLVCPYVWQYGITLRDYCYEFTEEIDWSGISEDKIRDALEKIDRALSDLEE